MNHPFIVVVTGLSGSGKSTALKAIEDEGFFCMDNIPIDLIAKFTEISDSASFDLPKVCIGMDVRAGASSFTEKASLMVSLLRGIADDVHLIFLEADKENLLNRYKETRRRHPLSDLYPNLLDAVDAEIEMLKPIREMADFIVNTSKMNVHELQTKIKNIISYEDKSRDIYIEIRSFGFKKGIPIDADIVMDVRFLPNPYFIESLKDKTGSDKEVKEFLEQQDSYIEFIQRFKDLIRFILPLYKKEGRSYLNIAVGCTGGRHRSVAVAEETSHVIEESGYSCKLIHRDIA
ncbi:MAG TPA: RNase adapter RapZ [Deltaproteobacteria bacterium]|nr:RNase adapter RapZ [Deltaproteobacteria bacterium]HPJ92313.1 RNase adapter RapZ [Deltaproteobacteria bacterium]HPR52332.1 RNase adapter RapZ [Deltaproteobacteria bacterium]